MTKLNLVIVTSYATLTESGQISGNSIKRKSYKNRLSECYHAQSNVLKYDSDPPVDHAQSEESEDDMYDGLINTQPSNNDIMTTPESEPPPILLAPPTDHIIASTPAAENSGSKPIR